MTSLFCDMVSFLKTRYIITVIHATKLNLKKFRLECIRTHDPLQYRCSALPTELSNQLGAAHMVTDPLVSCFLPSCVIIFVFCRFVIINVCFLFFLRLIQFGLEQRQQREGLNERKNLVNETSDCNLHQNSNKLNSESSTYKGQIICK